MPSLPAHPMKAIQELRSFIASMRADFRRRRDFASVIDTEAADQIASEIQSDQATASRHAYTAQQADEEAARLLAVAQRPDSPGGPAITPSEAGPILRNIRNSARHDSAVVAQFA